MPTKKQARLKVADEVWIATALLHIEHGKREDFSVAEIVERAEMEGLTDSLRPGVYVHVLQHCVANRAPNPGRYRMLYETAEGRRRLYREGDPCHPARQGAKMVPMGDEIPHEYQHLLDWYDSKYAPRQPSTELDDPLLSLKGSGKELWSEENADEYVWRLREGWQ